MVNRILAVGPTFDRKCEAKRRIRGLLADKKVVEDFKLLKNTWMFGQVCVSLAKWFFDPLRTRLTPRNGTPLQINMEPIYERWVLGFPC